ncbi:MAG TPA: endonuclease III [Oscillospiraceae bacterium]|nr:endonuclease III [Oscillospiraceae bacterium]HNW05376.1 endonuclease III [Oscillospiraceae bacterium]HPW00035.1 endonuclease III [Oscillospiraceae bacterium]
MTNLEKAQKATALLKEEYPDALCSLDYIKPHELLIATRLAAQCTDARVNLITPVLFDKYPTVGALAEAEESDIGEIIYSCGFYKTKSHDIVEMCRMLRDEYNGVVPDTVEELTKLPGVGRKTANLVVGDVYKKPAVVCDTHCIRITNLLGLTATKDPAKCETELRAVLDPAESNMFCHRLVLHGRAVCVARRPQCERCVLKEICAYYQSLKKTEGESE